ncbi:MAG TPA: prepilin peptidase [Arthrobacter sp.]
MTTVLDAPHLDIQPDALIPDKRASAETTEEYGRAGEAADKASSEAYGSVEVESGFNEAGLRELTGHDWLAAAAWGIAGAVATSAVSLPFLPMHLIALTFVLGAGLGVLGYLDHCTQLIRNKHTVVFGAAAAVLLTATQILIPAAQILIPALVAAAVTFVFMLGLAVITKFAGGGDIKLSPVPAALLAAVSPLAAMMWLLFTFVLCLGAMIAARLSGNTRKHVAMAPFMAIAAGLSLGTYGMLSLVLGI